MNEILQKIWLTFKPPRAYCWQTLFRLSLFSVLMAAIARGFIGEIIAIIGYFLLIVSIAWIGIENHWKFTPWLISALICLLFWGLFQIKPQILMILWLPLSAMVASLTNFITRNLEFKIPHAKEGQAIVILLEIQILLACWLQFYFLCNDWLQEYPSLLFEDFSESQFVVRLDFAPPPLRGLLILEGLEGILERNINDRPWTEAQKWLQESERTGLIPKFQQQIIEQLNSLPEDTFWTIESEISNTTSGYQWKLIAQWNGPRSNQTLDKKRDRGELVCDIRQDGDRARITCNLSRNYDFIKQ
ncbi:MAG: DUF5357 family protein [Spirulina sp.]